MNEQNKLSSAFFINQNDQTIQQCGTEAPSTQLLLEVLNWQEMNRLFSAPIISLLPVSISLHRVKETHVEKKTQN